MNKVLKIVAWVLILVPAAYLAMIWSSLPETVAVHFDLQGNPNRYGSKDELWLLVGIMAVASIICILLIPNAYKIDPKRKAAANKSILQKVSYAIVIFLSFISVIVINSSLHGAIRLNMRIVCGSMGILWCILGNYLYNIKPNYFAGFRLPWTLNSEDNWKKTHWLGGKLFFAGGIVLFIASLFLSNTALTVLMVVVAVIIAVIPSIYSYTLYRKEKKSINTDL